MYILMSFSFQTGESSRRYDGLGRVCKQINPPSDLAAFSRSAAADNPAAAAAVPVHRHNFAPPGPRAQQAGQVSLSLLS